MPVGFRLNYSPLDRMLHRLAFSGSSVQLTAADIERTLFGSSYLGVRRNRPIFITSLPRAGTTLLLEALHRFPSLASHVYRDMPFVMAPVLWSRASASFRKPAAFTQRAHGDGVEIGYDSPEAFEEILWRTFWPAKYTTSRISLWDASDGREDARAFLAEHMKKIIALRRPGRAHDGRYVSKNNANVARLDLIERMFPDAKIVIPIRRPLEHARSLLRQHLGFLQMHKESPFVREYMADIGHYEFGELHRPIAFPGLESAIGNRNPLELDYWLGYWIAAFEHLLHYRDKAVVVSYEATCLDAPVALSALCRRLDIPEEGMLPVVADLFRSAPSSREGGADADRGLLERAERLHGRFVDAQPG